MCLEGLELAEVSSDNAARTSSTAERRAAAAVVAAGPDALFVFLAAPAGQTAVAVLVGEVRVLASFAPAPGAPSPVVKTIVATD